MSHHLVGTAEVARILGVSRQRVSQLAASAELPEPAVVLSAGRVWERRVIEAWAADRPHRGPHRLDPDIPPSGSWPARVRQIVDIATAEADALHHDWLGLDHLFLALVHPNAPGSCRTLLGALGIRYADVQAALDEGVGERAPHRRGIQFAPSTQLVLERANLAAVQLADEEVTGEHVLLALLEKWPLQYLATYLRSQHLTGATLRREIIRFTEGGDAEAEPSWAHAQGRLELQRSPAGLEPEERRPWTSAFLKDDQGEPLRAGRLAVQYFIDRDGYPVRTGDGRYVHMLLDENGQPVLDDAGVAVLSPIETPSA